MVISPQLGHGNLVASAPGLIILLQDVHMGIETVLASLTGCTSNETPILQKTSIYMLFCASPRYNDAWMLKSCVKLEWDESPQEGRHDA